MNERVTKERMHESICSVNLFSNFSSTKFSIFVRDEIWNYSKTTNTLSSGDSSTSLLKRFLSGGHYEPKKVHNLIVRMDEEIKRLEIENVLYELYLKHISLLDYRPIAKSPTKLLDSCTSGIFSAPTLLSSKIKEPRESRSRILTSSFSQKTDSPFSKSVSNALLGVKSSSKLSNIIHQNQRLKTEIRLEIINSELNHLKNKHEKLRLIHKMNKITYLAYIEEINESLNVIHMTRMCLENNLGGDSSCSQDKRRIPAEKYLMVLTDIGFYFGKLREKMKLEISSLVLELTKLSEKLRRLKHLGENVRPIDFEELKINAFENSIALQKKEKHLNALEKITGKTDQDLFMHKRDLELSIEDLKNLRKTVTMKEKVLKKIKEVKEKTDQELMESLSENLFVRKTVNEQQAPSIMNLARIKAKQQEIEKNVKFWNRRTKFQENSLILIRNKWKKIKYAYKCKQGY